MIDVKDGLNFEEYLKKDEKYEVMYKKCYENTLLSEENIDKIKELKETVNIVIFSEGYCPDCAVTLPFLEKIQSYNKNIKIGIFPRSGNEQLIEEFTGDSRIPTVLSFSKNMEPKGAYVEVPEEVTTKLISSPSKERGNLIEDYRKGKYNNLIEEQLVKIITL